MRPIGSLRDWLHTFLPHANAFAHAAAFQLLTSLLTDFTTSLSALAREIATAEQPTAGLRQKLRRWLGRKSWDPEQIYVGLLTYATRLLAHPHGPLPLLLDMTHLANGWSVLQVSFPWEGRALPLYRAVVSYTACEEQQTALVLRALHWLVAHLPGGQRQGVVVMDRGFPSHELLKSLQAAGWRYVIRINRAWKMTHPAYTGWVKDGAATLTPGAPGRYFAGATLGNRNKGRKSWSETAVVWWRGVEHAEPWILVTSEATAALAYAIYRQRMQIECEFRDLKGPLGLDHLAKWQDRDRVACFLAWVAVYEWRLALLFVTRRLKTWGRHCLQVGGRLSWINIARQWARRHLPLALGAQTAVRDTP